MRYKSIDDQLIGIDDRSQNIWANGEISIENQLKDLLKNNNQEIFTVSHKMDEATPEHKHTFYEIMYVYKGAILNITQNKNIYMSEGDFCIMNLASSHSLQVLDASAILVNICIRKESFTNGYLRSFYENDNLISLFFREKSEEDYLYFPKRIKSDINLTISEILSYSDGDLPTNNFRLAGNILLLLAELLDREAYSYHGIDEKTFEILTYISKNYQHTSLEDIADKFNYNKTYLSRYIKQHVGKQLTTLITEQKMDQASKLLLTTQVPVSTIAEDLGYQSLSHFHKVFKNWFELTPNEYRNNSRK